MPLFQCHNPDCSGSETSTYVFENKYPICPKCQAGIPDVTTVVMVHLLYYSKTGQLRGSKGRKVAVACNTVVYSDPFNSLSVDPTCTTCPACLNSDAYKQIWMPNPNEPASFFKDPNMTTEDIENIMKGVKHDSSA